MCHERQKHPLAKLERAAALGEMAALEAIAVANLQPLLLLLLLVLVARVARQVQLSVAAAAQ